MTDLGGGVELHDPTVPKMAAKLNDAGEGAGKGSGSGSRSSRIPVPEEITAKNGLRYKSHSKHTPGASGNRLNAGIEPRNSLELFENSVPSSKKVGARFAFDEKTETLHRFYNDGNGTWHWSGSTNQGINSIPSGDIPPDIKRYFGLKMKG